MTYKAVVIGQGFTGRLSIVRSLAELGCEVTLIVLTFRNKITGELVFHKPVDAFSKYVRRAICCENYNAEMLVDILLNQCADPAQKTFIFPDNDFSAIAVDDHYDVLKEHFYCPNVKGQQGGVRYWMDKVRQKALAEELGLPVTRHTVIPVRGGAFTIPDTVTYPCFAKAQMSVVGSKLSLRKCNTREELEAHLKFLAAWKDAWRNIDVLVEEYKHIDTEYATLGFSDGKQVVIPGMIEMIRMAHGTHYGVALQGKVYPVADRALIDRFAEMVRRIGFVGIFDVDFYESDGVVYFCELNLRFGGSGYAFTRMGVNLPAMMVRSFTGEDIDKLEQNIHGSATFFNERMGMDEWMQGFMSRREVRRLRKESDIKFVADRRDPGPQRALDFDYAKRIIKKALGRL